MLLVTDLFCEIRPVEICDRSCRGLLGCPFFIIFHEAYGLLITTYTTRSLILIRRFRGSTVQLELLHTSSLVFSVQLDGWIMLDSAWLCQGSETKISRPAVWWACENYRWGLAAKIPWLAEHKVKSQKTVPYCVLWSCSILMANLSVTPGVRNDGSRRHQMCQNMMEIYTACIVHVP